MEPKRDFLKTSEIDSLVEEIDYKIVDLDFADLDLEFGLVGDEEIRINFALPTGDQVHLSGDIANKFIGRIGMPKGVVKEYGSNPRLLKSLEEFSRKKRLSETIRITFARGMAIGIDGGSGVQIDLDDAWSIIKTMPGIEGVQWLRQFDNSFEFRVVSGEVDHPPKAVDDLSHAGIWTRVNGKIETGSYVMRLACTNGYLSNYNCTSRKMKSYEREELLHHYRGMLMDAWTESKELLKSYISLSRKKAEKAVSMMMRFFSENRLPRRLQADFMEYVPVLPDEPTLYDVVNLTAEFGRDQAKIRDRLKLERLAGDVTVEMTDDHIKRCRRCYHIL